jgi:hypothetical protein
MPIHEEIAAAIHALSADMDQRHSENVTRQLVTDRKVDEVIRRVDDLHNAFPGGDWNAHRKAHEAMIARHEAKARFYEELRVDLAQKGLWALIVGLATAIWYFFRSKVSA